jgi:hypothetical protein
VEETGTFITLGQTCVQGPMCILLHLHLHGQFCGPVLWPYCKGRARGIRYKQAVLGAKSGAPVRKDVCPKAYDLST